MFRKILIANRGEIAVRIIRAARELGIATVAVYSTADKEALHTLLADEAICIGPGKATESYLNINAILSAAVLTEAEAIHPGFGFLSENSKFATMCEEVGIKFIGPSARVMDVMGDKINARAQMIKANVPVIPGSDGEVHTAEEALAIAEKIGYPVMLKASAGGGGKGIRKVEKAEDLVSAFETASSEAKANFGNGAMYLERVIYPARHIEVQILADQMGHVIHLGERDCSLQRNNQKVLEESPSIAIGKTLRNEIGAAAVRAAESVGYENAGTIEFLLDEATGKFYFMEMNTRVQVEHPVTEFVSGVDIVKEQIRIAAGQPLAFKIDKKQPEKKLEQYTLKNIGVTSLDKLSYTLLYLMSNKVGKVERVKGNLTIQDNNYKFDLVGNNYEITGNNNSLGNNAVVIGTNLNRDIIEKLFEN